MAIYNSVTDNEIEQAKKYKAALDELEKSVVGLNSKLPSFADGLKAGLQGIGEKLPEVVDAMMKLNAQNKELAASGQKPKSMLTELGSALFTWNNALHIGISLITTYGPKVLSFIGNLFESSKAREAAQALRDYNDVLLNYTKAVSKQRGEFETLLAVSKNNKLADETRIEAIKKLNDLAPNQLKSLSLANINTKEGTAAIDEYTKALKRKAIEEAAQVKMAGLIKEKMNMADDFNDAKKKVEYYREGKKKDKYFGQETFSNRGAAVGTTTTIDHAAIAEKTLSKFEEKDASLKKRINDVNKLVAGQLNSLAPKDAHAVNLTGKAYWDKLLENQQAELYALNAKAGDFEAKSKPIITKIRDTQRKLAKYDVEVGQKPKNQSNSNDAEKAFLESKERQAELLLSSYATEIDGVNKHFDDIKKQYKGNKATIEQIEKERVATLTKLNNKFRDEDLQKLDNYQQELTKSSREAGKTAQELAIQQLTDEHDAKTDELTKTAIQAETDQKNIRDRMDDLRKQGRLKDAESLQVALINETNIITKANNIKLQIDAKFIADQQKLNEGFEKEKAAKLLEKETGQLQNNIENAHDKGDWQAEFQQKQILLNIEKQQAIDAARTRNESVDKVDRDYKQKQQQLDKAKLDAQAESQKKYLKSTETLSNAVMSIFGRNTVASRVAFKAHQAAAAAQVIIDTKRSIMGIWAANANLPFIGVPKAIAETVIVAAAGASSLASIIKQKPGFAQGGQYLSDGRGALLPGYSRTDNTNAYLRSGEAVVVSEAMRNPWARNLVSAINVAHGGRDFSVPNTGRGYAIGGIFTDGGNANRYYNQPVNDAKELANTLAYQMINNFPPIYVDVKDVNNQQNILAQTVNRVNL